ncbi:TrlF family AAA-like ATPase [Flavobacterium aquidurense]|uniref:TrlF family AAA-like ATPase n=1 Tax=Flavobacterium aquidurense TaxID=362413 RepID=UPI003756BAA7
MAIINRGSEWRKWDLHFHTPSSYDYQDKSITNEKIIEILEKNNISVVAITDHHLIDVEKIIDLQNIGKNKNITVLPGIEFRAELGGSESIHYIGIFSEKLNKQELSDIWIKLQSTCKITQTDIQAIGGDANIQCDFKETSNLIHELGGLVTVHAGTKANTFENITNSLPDKIAQKVSLVKGYIDIFELGKEIDQTSYNNIVFPNLGFKLPMIICSDNHKITDYIVKQNLWIKANPTFEGLKQITYEPEERVRIQKEQPESEKLDNLMIEKITFQSLKGRFTNEPIYFNKNLNVIIGGKSSGKSILLYEIARTLYSHVSDKVLKYTDIEDSNKEKDLYDLTFVSKDIFDLDYNFSVELFSKSKQSLEDRVSQSSILPSIKYIPQNHLANLVDKSRKNGATLKKLIRDLILEDPDYKTKYDDFVTHAQRNDEKRSHDIDYYFTLKNDLKKKEEDLLTKGDTKALKEGIEFNKQKIAQLNKDFTPEEQIQYKELTEKLSSLNIKENEINSDFEKLDVFRADITRIFIEVASKKKILLDSLQNENIRNEYVSKLQFLDEALTNVTEITKQFIKDESNKFIDDSIFAKELVFITVDKESVSNGLKVFNDKLENQKQVTAIQKSITEDESKIAAIEQFLKEIQTTKNTIDSQKEKIFTDFATNLKLYETIIEDLKPRIADVQNETDKIEILPVVRYNFPKFRKLVDEVFNARSFNNHGFEYLYQYVNNNPKSALVEVDYNEIEKALRAMFEKIENNQLIPKGGNSQKDACGKIFTDFFFDHWDVKSQGDDIHKMSTGKASFVLLKLIIKLSKDDGPILIDQPEDNLDNRSVSHELVEFLKEKKRERQIILVTHNPNIVVNADAENIIVANQKGQNDTEDENTSDYRFDYINGALEDSFPKNGNTDLLRSMGIREHVAEIVEGGKEAFKKREKKYGF